jgi:hypothetical protein
MKKKKQTMTNKLLPEPELESGSSSCVFEEVEAVEIQLTEA